MKGRSSTVEGWFGVNCGPRRRLTQPLSLFFPFWTVANLLIVLLLLHLLLQLPLLADLCIFTLNNAWSPSGFVSLG